MDGQAKEETNEWGWADEPTRRMREEGTKNELGRRFLACQGALPASFTPCPLSLPSASTSPGQQDSRTDQERPGFIWLRLASDADRAETLGGR